MWISVYIYIYVFIYLIDSLQKFSSSMTQASKYDVRNNFTLNDDVCETSGAPKDFSSPRSVGKSFEISWEKLLVFYQDFPWNLRKRYPPPQEKTTKIHESPENYIPDVRPPKNPQLLPKTWTFGLLTGGGNPIPQRKSLFGGLIFEEMWPRNLGILMLFFGSNLPPPKQPDWRHLTWRMQSWANVQPLGS